MKSFFIALCLAVTCVVMASAQNTDGYKKGEFFVGYSNQQIDTGLGDIDDSFGLDFDKRETFHGFNVSGVYNVGRYFGLKADVSGAYNNRNFSFNVPGGTGPEGAGTSTLAFRTKSSLYNFLGGVQIKDNSNSGRLKPFAHALVGAAHTRATVSNVVCPVGDDCSGLSGGDSETNLAGAFGGGLDVRLSRRVQLRLVQVDYNPIWSEGHRQNNIRFGFGLVF